MSTRAQRLFVIISRRWKQTVYVDVVAAAAAAGCDDHNDDNNFNDNEIR